MRLFCNSSQLVLSFITKNYLLLLANTDFFFTFFFSFFLDCFWMLVVLQNSPLGPGGDLFLICYLSDISNPGFCSFCFSACPNESYSFFIAGIVFCVPPSSLSPSHQSVLRIFLPGQIIQQLEKVQKASF